MVGIIVAIEVITKNYYVFDLYENGDAIYRPPNLIYLFSSRLTSFVLVLLE